MWGAIGELLNRFAKPIAIIDKQGRTVVWNRTAQAVLDSICCTDVSPAALAAKGELLIIVPPDFPGVGRPQWQIFVRDWEQVRWTSFGHPGLTPADLIATLEQSYAGRFEAAEHDALAAWLNAREREGNAPIELMLNRPSAAPMRLVLEAHRAKAEGCDRWLEAI
jgi:hypothetical protein